MNLSWSTIGLAQFWPYLAAVGGAVTLLYLLKLRRRQVQVPFSPLWARVLEERQSTRLLQKLKRLFSWLVQLAFVALVLFALTDPNVKDWKMIKVEEPTKRHVVMIIDSSASMSTRDIDGKSRFEKAIQTAERLIKQLNPNDRMMLLEMAGTVKSGTFTTHKKVLLQQLKRMQVNDTGTNFREALDLAGLALKEKKEKLLVVISDGAFEQIAGLKKLKLPYRFVQLGSASGNIGITQLNVRPYLDDSLKYEIYLRVKNYTDKELKAKVTFYSRNHPLASKKKRTKRRKTFEGMQILDSVALTIPAGKEKLHVLKDKKFLQNRLVAHLELDPGQGVVDLFPRDDVAYALVPERRKIRVLAVSDSNNYLYAALFLRENLSFKLIEPSKYKPEMTKKYDLVIFDRFAPKPFPTTGNFMLIEPPKHGPFKVVEVKVLVQPAIGRVNKRHRLTRHLDFEDLTILFAVPIKLLSRDRAPVKSRSGWPLMITRSTREQKLIALAFDVRKSTLPLQTTFPIMLVDAINWFFDEDQELFIGYQSGSHLAVPVAVNKSRSMSVRRPDGRLLMSPVFDKKARFYAPQAGFYRLFHKKVEQYVAVNLKDEREAAIGPRTKLYSRRDDADKLSIRVAQQSDKPWKKFWRSLLLAAMVITVVEWLTYHRRWTV